MRIHTHIFLYTILLKVGMFAIITHALTGWLLEGEKFRGRVRNWRVQTAVCFCHQQQKKNTSKDITCLQQQQQIAVHLSVAVAQPTFNSGSHNAQDFLKHKHI